jgi:hypothetical protein
MGNEQDIVNKVKELLGNKTSGKLSEYVASHHEIITKGWLGVDKEISRELIDKICRTSIEPEMIAAYIIGYRRGHGDATKIFVEKWSNPDDRKRLLYITS